MANLTLEIVEGPGAGRQVPVDGTIEIGRDQSAQFVLSDELVSRHHARIVATPTAVVVEDLGSSNGTFVNGNEVHSPTPLQAGDQLLFGVTVMELRTAAEVARQPSAVRNIPPGLVIPQRRPDYTAGLELPEHGQAPSAPSGANRDLDPLLDRFTKRQARTAPLAVFALLVIAIILFVVLYVRRQ